MKRLRIEIGYLKRQLDCLILLKQDLLDTDILNLSQKIDKLLNEYNNLMLNGYNKAG